MSHKTSHSASDVMPRSFLQLAALTLFSSLSVALITGCGKSETPDSTIVTPPGPVGEIDGGSTDTQKDADPPGGLELPSGEIPSVDTQEKPDPKDGGLEMPAGGNVPAAESGASKSSTIRYGTWEEIQQQVKTSGKVTVVDLWSLSCEPCLKEFPGLVRLHQSFGDSVQCVAMDMDFDGRKTRPPEYYEDRVAAFVESVGAKFATYISRTPSDEVYAATGLDSIPAVLIYDAKGELVKVFADAGETVGFTYDKDIIPFVTKLAG